MVYRKPEPFVSIDGLEPVAVVTQPGARSWEDDTVAPQSEYFYALAVKDPAGNISEPVFSGSARTGIFLRQGVSVGAIVPDYGQGSQSQSLLDIIFNFFRR